MGIVSIVLGVIRLGHQKTWIKTEAVITQLEYSDGVGVDDSGDWTVLVAYDAEGTHYEAELDEYSSFFREGQSVMVRYNPENPAQITANGTAILIVVIVGGILLLFGAVITFLRG